MAVNNQAVQWLFTRVLAAVTFFLIMLFTTFSFTFGSVWLKYFLTVNKMWSCFPQKKSFRSFLCLFTELIKCYNLWNSLKEALLPLGMLRLRSDVHKITTDRNLLFWSFLMFVIINILLDLWQLWWLSCFF